MSTPPSPADGEIKIAEVRYPLPVLLKELVHERTTGSLAMEKLNQSEIARLFTTKKAKRRA